MAEEDVQALRRIYNAFSRWDIDELWRDVSHDFEMNLPETLPFGGTRHGYDGVQAFANVHQDYVQGPWADPDDFLDAGDRVVVLGRTRGRAARTGREFEMSFAHVWTLSDGVASRCRVYVDSAPFLAALEGKEAPDAD
jgi:ketosteroid isomerase-like protein